MSEEREIRGRHAHSAETEIVEAALDAARAQGVASHGAQPHKTRATIREAWDAEHRGDFSEAITLHQRVIKQRPTSPGEWEPEQEPAPTSYLCLIRIMFHWVGYFKEVVRLCDEATHYLGDIDGREGLSQDYVDVVNLYRRTAVALMEAGGQMTDERRWEELNQCLNGDIAWATALVKGGHRKGALDVNLSDIALYPHPVHELTRRLLAGVMLDAAMAFERSASLAEALALYDGMQAEFGEDDDPITVPKLARCLANKAILLMRQGRREESIDAYGEILRRWGTTNDPAMSRTVAEAAWSKGSLEGGMGRFADERQSYQVCLRIIAFKDRPAKLEAGKGVVNLAIAEGEQGNHTASLQAGMAVIEYMSDMLQDDVLAYTLPAHLAVGRAYVAMGLAPAARRHYEFVMANGSDRRMGNDWTRAREEFGALPPVR